MVDIYLRPVPATGPIPADVWLYGPVLELLNRLRLGRPPKRPYIPKPGQRVCPIHDPGVCRRVYSSDGSWYCIPVAVTARSLLENLQRQYGTVEGNNTYLAMRHNQQGPFAIGAKYDVTKVPARRAPAPGRFSIRRGTSARAANEGKRESYWD